MVYTFSFTVDWPQTVNAVAPMSAAAAAPAIANRRASKKLEITRCATKNRKLEAAALVTAASRLMRTATGSPRGAKSRLQVLASTTKSGFPGG